jgi:hypothetical protein
VWSQLVALFDKFANFTTAALASHLEELSVSTACRLQLLFGIELTLLAHGMAKTKEIDVSNMCQNISPSSLDCV